MDFNEKDAARSKHKLSKRNQRGRGRGRGAQGWRGSAGTTRQTRDLGTNIDRYESDNELDQHSEGPVRQSQGGDLAEWLDQHPAEDPLFHARQRVNLHQEVGLPPAELDTFQGLSFDLKGLAECLSKLPLHEVLNLPPPIDEHGNPVVAKEEESTRIEDSTDGIDTGSILRSVESEPKYKSLPEKLVAAKDHQQPPQPPPPSTTAKPIPLSKTQPVAIVTEELDSMNINVAEDDIDDELDALLGLGDKKTGGVVAPVKLEESNKEESLEAWLDNL